MAVVAGVTLTCDRYTRVLTGPVVGLVTGDTARLLLEVDKTTEVVCHVCLVDESCPGGREVGTFRQLFEARKPATFAINRLLPGERYICSFSGVTRDDALKRLADFTTVDLHKRELRVMAVAGDRPESVVAGEFNLWETVYERVRHHHLPPVSVMIHAGGQVHLQQAFEDAWVLLKRHAEISSSFRPGHWEALVEQVGGNDRIRLFVRLIALSTSKPQPIYSLVAHPNPILLTIDWRTCLVCSFSWPAPAPSPPSFPPFIPPRARFFPLPGRLSTFSYRRGTDCATRTASRGTCRFNERSSQLYLISC